MLRSLIMVAALLLAGIANAQELSIRPVIGGFPTASGFALGAAVTKTRFAGPIDAHAKGIVSVKKYELYEAGLAVPEISRWFSFDVTGGYHNYPQEVFWGLGPNTDRESRTNYLYEDVDITATLSARIASRIHAGLSAGFLKINTGPGRDRQFPSVPEPQQASPRYTHTGAFLNYDSLDEPADPHNGGKYSFQFTNYAPGLQRYEVDLRRFLPLTASDRIGLRMNTSFTRSFSQVPFFMLPTVGGIDTVRGFDQYRFRDRNALVMNAEYRRPLGGFLDVVAFADAGRVFARARNLGLQGLRPSAGIGARVKFGSRVFFGIDLGFSREGAKLWFRSDQAF